MKRREVIKKAVADMLSINKRVEVMSFYDDAFDKTIREEYWNMNVFQRLECNLYRKRCPSIHKIVEASWQSWPANRIWY
jgi:hypothetical protein